jgi:hypothetical protein
LTRNRSIHARFRASPAIRRRMVERSRFEAFAARLLPARTCTRSAGRERRPQGGR